jgi:hypothetical protein
VESVTLVKGVNGFAAIQPFNRERDLRPRDRR